MWFLAVGRLEIYVFDDSGGDIGPLEGVLRFYLRAFGDVETG